jgi:hypothetical protein
VASGTWLALLTAMRVEKAMPRHSGGMMSAMYAFPIPPANPDLPWRWRAP